MPITSMSVAAIRKAHLSTAGPHPRNRCVCVCVCVLVHMHVGGSGSLCVCVCVPVFLLIQCGFYIHIMGRKIGKIHNVCSDVRRMCQRGVCVCVCV